MTDIQCSICGELSADQRAFRTHICRPPSVAVIAYPPAMRTHESRITDTRSSKTRDANEYTNRLASSSRYGKGNMSNIILCDRCGSIATSKVAGWMEYSFNPEEQAVNAGLCPGCCESLYVWVNEGGTQPKALTAYREPFNPESVDSPIVDQVKTTREAIEGELSDE